MGSHQARHSTNTGNKFQLQRACRSVMPLGLPNVTAWRISPSIIFLRYLFSRKTRKCWCQLLALPGSFLDRGIHLVHFYRKSSLLFIPCNRSEIHRTVGKRFIYISRLHSPNMGQGFNRCCYHYLQQHCQESAGPSTTE